MTETVVEETLYKYGSSQLEFSAADTALLQRAHDVADNVLTVEHDTHLTIRYGVVDFDPSRVKRQIEAIEPIVVTIEDIDCFPDTKDGAAVYFRVKKTDDLTQLREIVENGCECVEPTFPDYKPHITIGYFNPAAWRVEADKIRALYTFPFDIIADNFVVSQKTGKQFNFPLHKNHAANKIAHLIKNQLSEKDQLI